MKRFFLIFLIFLLSGCASTPPQMKSQDISKPTIEIENQYKFDTALLITNDQRSQTFIGKPTTYISSAFTAKVELGRILQEVTLEEYGNLFSELRVISSLEDASPLTLIIKPKITHYSWQGGGTSLQSSVSVQVTIVLNSVDFKVASYKEQVRVKSQAADVSGDVSLAARKAISQAIRKNIEEVLSEQSLAKRFDKLEKESAEVFSKNYQDLKGIYRVVDIDTEIRLNPYRYSRIVKRFKQGKIVGVIGKLPSGWLHVTEDGIPIGWAYESDLRLEDSIAESSTKVLAGYSQVRSESMRGHRYGQFFALVIGNSNYKSLPALETAIIDADTVAETLRTLYGFKITLLINASRADIINSLTDFRRKLTSSDNLLIYYAGHGWLDKDAERGYWLPIDAEEDNPTNWLSNVTITDALKAMRANHVIVVADSCYSGTLTRGINLTVRTPEYISRLITKRSRTVLTSGGLEPVLDSGGGKHSVFAKAFLSAIKENDTAIDGNTLFVKIRRSVIVNSDQTPEYGDIHKAGHDGGEFIFIRIKKRQ